MHKVRSVFYMEMKYLSLGRQCMCNAHCAYVCTLFIYLYIIVELMVMIYLPDLQLIQQRGSRAASRQSPLKLERFHKFRLSFVNSSLISSFLSSLSPFNNQIINQHHRFLEHLGQLSEKVSAFLRKQTILYWPNG